MLTMFRVILKIFLQYKYCQWFTIVNGLKVFFNLNTGIFNCFIFTMKYIFHTRFLSFWTSHIFNGFTFCGGAENVVNGFKFCFFVNFERKRDIFGLGIAIFYFSLEVEHFLHQYSGRSLWTKNGVNKICMPLSALLGPLKVWFFLHFQGLF